MGIMNMRLWHKAYMLEFVRDKAVEECFTFALPPESEELQFTHRVSETKTFGGSVFDSYGEDAIHITLSGSTVNEEDKFIFHGYSKMPDIVSGEEEIFSLQKLIAKWNAIDPEPGEKKIYLYDLSKTAFSTLAITGKASRNWWQVIIKDFKIKRDKGNPYAYNYTLDMLGVEETVTIPNDKLSLANAMAGIQKVQQVAKLIKASIAATNMVIAQIKKTVQKFTSDDLNPMKVASTLVWDAPMRIMTGDSSQTAYNSAKETLSLVSKVSHKWYDDDYDGGFTEKPSKHKSALTHSVMFMSRGGSIVKSQKVTDGGTAVEPTKPTREGFTFKGWTLDTGAVYDFKTEVKKDIILYAMWVSATVTITFDARDGEQVTRATIKTGLAVKEPAPPEKKGAVFMGWTTDKGAAYDFNTLVWQNITLVASWDRYNTITFDTAGGSEVTAQTVRLGALAICPKAPTKDGAIFIKWCIDAAFTREYDWSTPPQEDITLYADFAQNMNTVTFDATGGSEVAAQILPLGKMATVPNAPTREGYTFKAWITENGERFNFNQVVTHSLTLRAEWTINRYTVTFNSDNGTYPASKSVEYNTLVTPLYPSPTKAGNIFCGWLDDTGTAYDWNEPVKDNMTLTASWHTIGGA